MYHEVWTLLSLTGFQYIAALLSSCQLPCQSYILMQQWTILQQGLEAGKTPTFKKSVQCSIRPSVSSLAKLPEQNSRWPPGWRACNRDKLIPSWGVIAKSVYPSTEWCRSFPISDFPLLWSLMDAKELAWYIQDISAAVGTSSSCMIHYCKKLYLLVCLRAKQSGTDWQSFIRWAHQVLDRRLRKSVHTWNESRMSWVCMCMLPLAASEGHSGSSPDWQAAKTASLEAWALASTTTRL